MDYRPLNTPERNLQDLLAEQNGDGFMAGKSNGQEPFNVLAAKTICNADSRPSSLAALGIDDSIWQKVYASNDYLSVYWPLSEPAGLVAYDASRLGMDGIVSAGAVRGDGLSGRGITMVAGNNYVYKRQDSLNAEVLSAVFSMSMWIKPTGIQTSYGNGVFSFGESTKGWRMTLYLHPPIKTPQMEIFTDGVVRISVLQSSDYGIPMNEWTHVGVTYDGSVLKYYVNGELAASATGVPYTPITTANAQFRIGSINVPGYSGDTFLGSLDEFKYFSKALTADEIRAHYLIGAQTGGLIVANNTRWLNPSTGALLATVGKIHAMAPVALTYAAPTSIGVTTGSVFTVTTTDAVGNATFNATAGGVAGQSLTIIITNDATSAKTITFGTNFLANGTLTPSGVGKIATIDFVYNGTNFVEKSRTVLP